ncbi:MAG: AlbA family DNA-binding domain-containing protein [Thermomicrobiales bacterium]
MVNVVEHHRFEPGQFDFKEVLNATGKGSQEARDSLRRTICSMANTDGGYVLFGVRDLRALDATVNARIVGIPLGGDLRKEFGDKVGAIRPDVYFDARAIPQPEDPGRAIFVVAVPRSPRRPHMVEPQGIFYRRGEGGMAVAMMRHEVHEQMMFTEERLRRAALFRIQMALFKQMAEHMLRYGNNVVASPDRFDTAAFGGLLADVISLIPANYHFVERLLDIRIAASRVNVLLDAHLQGHSKSGGTPQDVQGNLLNIVNRCRECEEELRVTLGPLGTASDMQAT